MDLYTASAFQAPPADDCIQPVPLRPVAQFHLLRALSGVPNPVEALRAVLLCAQETAQAQGAACPLESLALYVAVPTAPRGECHA
jgi:hypothetical protein